MAQVSIRCEKCGAQRKVPSTAKIVACRKCGARIQVEGAGAPGSGTRRSTGSRPTGGRASGSRARSGSRRAARKLVAQPVAAEAPPRRGGGRRSGEKKPDNTVYITTGIICVAVVVGGFFMLVSGGGSHTPSYEERGSSGGGSGSSGGHGTTRLGAGSVTLQPWEVCVAFSRGVANEGQEEILEYFDPEGYARANATEGQPVEIPRTEGQRLRYVDRMRHELPGWLDKVNLSSESERMGASSNEVIVEGLLRREPAVTFRLHRLTSTAPWKVYDFTLHLGQPTADDEASGGGAGDGDGGAGGGGAGEEADAGPRRARVPEFLADFESTTEADRASIEEAIKQIMGGDTRLEEDCARRFKEVGQRSVPIALRYLRSVAVTPTNYMEVNALINLMSEVAPGDYTEKPFPADLMGGQSRAVENKILDWLDWWKENHAKYRE